jgi:hypothetical protein
MQHTHSVDVDRIAAWLATSTFSFDAMDVSGSAATAGYVDAAADSPGTFGNFDSDDEDVQVYAEDFSWYVEFYQLYGRFAEIPIAAGARLLD